MKSMLSVSFGAHVAFVCSTKDVISGIEMLNEPATTYFENGPITMSLLKDFYTRAYAEIRSIGWEGTIFNNGYLPSRCLHLPDYAPVPGQSGHSLS